MYNAARGYWLVLNLGSGIGFGFCGKATACRCMTTLLYAEPAIQSIVLITVAEDMACFAGGYRGTLANDICVTCWVSLQAPTWERLSCIAASASELFQGIVCQSNNSRNSPDIYD